MILYPGYVDLQLLNSGVPKKWKISRRNLTKKHRDVINQSFQHIILQTLKRLFRDYGGEGSIWLWPQSPSIDHLFPKIIRKLSTCLELSSCSDNQWFPLSCDPLMICFRHLLLLLTKGKPPDWPWGQTGGLVDREQIRQIYPSNIGLHICKFAHFHICTVAWCTMLKAHNTKLQSQPRDCYREVNDSINKWKTPERPAARRQKAYFCQQ